MFINLFQYAFIKLLIAVEKNVIFVKLPSILSKKPLINTCHLPKKVLLKILCDTNMGFFYLTFCDITFIRKVFIVEFVWFAMFWKKDCRIYSTFVIFGPIPLPFNYNFITRECILSYSLRLFLGTWNGAQTIDFNIRFSIKSHIVKVKIL